MTCLKVGQALTASCLMLSAPAVADVYHLTLCGNDPGCEVAVSAPSPTPQNLTAGSLAVFFASSGFPDDATYSLNAIDYTTASGLSIGSAFTSGFGGGFTLPIVASGGDIMCCDADYPSFLAFSGINDSGLLIGAREFSVPFLTAVGAFDWLGTPPLDAPSDALLAAVSGPGLRPFENTTFIAVDDQGRIAGSGYFGTYLLTPDNLVQPAAVIAAPVGEPSAILLLAAALAAATGFLRKAQKSG